MLSAPKYQFLKEKKKLLLSKQYLAKFSLFSLQWVSRCLCFILFSILLSEGETIVSVLLTLFHKDLLESLHFKLYNNCPIRTTQYHFLSLSHTQTHIYTHTYTHTSLSQLAANEQERQEQNDLKRQENKNFKIVGFVNFSYD